MATDQTMLAGEIAYQLTKRLVIDISTARAAVDAALSAATPAPAGQSEQDAARLQWLFDNADCTCVKDSQWQIWFDLPDVCYGNPPTELRSAIDAARARGEGNGNG